MKLSPSTFLKPLTTEISPLPLLKSQHQVIMKLHMQQYILECWELLFSWNFQFPSLCLQNTSPHLLFLFIGDSPVGSRLPFKDCTSSNLGRLSHHCHCHIFVYLLHHTLALVFSYHTLLHTLWLLFNWRSFRFIQGSTFLELFLILLYHFQ
jgi:hypothetical protein